MIREYSIMPQAFARRFSAVRIGYLCLLLLQPQAVVLCRASPVLFPSNFRRSSSNWWLLDRRRENDSRNDVSPLVSQKRHRHRCDPGYSNAPSLMIMGGSLLNRLSRVFRRHPRAWALACVGGYIVHRHGSQSEALQRATYFWWHAAPIVIHYKFTKFWLTLQHADASHRDLVYEQLHDRYATPALDLILNLKGLYIKLGQVLSARPDFMPPQYTRVFTTLQDDVPTVDGMQSVALQSLRLRCGEALRQYDAIEWDDTPLGSASIGQVHRAVLVQGDQRTTVAVKVMRPGSEERFEHDFSVFRWLCRVAIQSWRPFLQALHEQVMTEFDYRNEAISLNEVRKNMEKSPYRRKVQIPYAFTDLCCKDVLVMEMLEGKRLSDAIRDQFVTAWGGNATAATQFLENRKEQVMTGNVSGGADALNNLSWHAKVRLWRLSRRCTGWVELLVKIHGHQIFCDGVWNGDPHFGNLLQLDNGRLGLIDYGQTRRIDDSLRKAFANIVVTLHEDGDNQSSIAAAMEHAGFKLKDPTDHRTMAHYSSLMFDSDIISEKMGYRIPQEYFQDLMEKNPLIELPDSSVFVARTSLMFRGMGSAIGRGQIQTAERWHEHAKRALNEPDKNPAT